MTKLHDRVATVIERVNKRSHDSRSAYLEDIEAMETAPDSDRRGLACSNLAHAAAGAGEDQQTVLGTAAGTDDPSVNIGIITAYNDMLSAHQPFETYPQVIRAAARSVGATAQVAGGVPAMCDGVTQGRPGMELSLMSRDVIAMATAVGLSHGVYDAALCLGVCDKIVPGLVIGALSFGHLPTIFVPAGPMTSGMPNDQKAAVRKAFARGEASRAELLESEAAAYHGPGTCTFYGTANSNQMLMEIMGLHLPGAAFINPQDDLRHAMTVAATQQAVAIARRGKDPRPIGRVLNARSFVNAIVGLHATGGSTNHTLHLPAMAAAAGITLTWQDFADLSEVTPLLARVYPNGKADVNHFHAAGGIGFVMRELIDNGLLDGSASTIFGDSLDAHAAEPRLGDSGLHWQPASTTSLDPDILRPVSDPHAPNGGLQMLDGNFGKAVIKIAAVAADRQRISAPAAIFNDEAAVKAAYADGKLDRDVVVVVRGQGPQANGMPELHSLTPILSNLQDRGFAVALVTDGRMSGASGTVPAAIHVTPEAVAGGAIGRLQDGDMITLDAVAGRLETDADLATRVAAGPSNMAPQRGFARPLFQQMRNSAAPAEQGGGLPPRKDIS